MKILYFFVMFPILNNINCQLLPPLPAPNLTFLDQSLALIFPIIQDFKNTITLGPFGVTQSWTGPDICSYKGFYCANPPHNSSAISLASIDFNGFQLSAPTLDGFIDRLPDLAIFHANSNNFWDIISSKFSNLPYLYELDHSNNQSSTLTFLDICYNLFAGIIPPQIFVQYLNAFFLNNNNFIQKLPDNLGSTTAFYLTLANNKFAPNLLEILFLNNLLTGCIPDELGLLEKATVIDVGFNMLTGPLPCSLGCLESGPLCRKLIKSGVLNVEKKCIRGFPNQISIVECVIFNFSIIPCNISKFSSHRPPRAERHLISYSALSKHTKLYL
ncbi:unnamed protein product [Withania somnifera]